MDAQPSNQGDVSPALPWFRRPTAVAVWVLLVSLVGWLLYSVVGPGKTVVRVAYLQENELGQWELAAAQLNDPTYRQLLSLPGEDLLEFAVSPNGRSLAYIIQHADGRQQIRLLQWNGRQASQHQTLLDCEQGSCGQLLWHPDGRRLVYQQRQAGGPRLWWLDSQTGETVTVLADATAVSQGAALSADGNWLSYADPLHEEMVLYSFVDGTQHRLSNVLGSTAVWHPALSQFLFSDVSLLVFHGDGEQTDHQAHEHAFEQSFHLYSGDSSGNWHLLLGSSSNVDDANPAWSPDGQWIAFGRKPAGTSAGRQLWLMRADGSEARPLTADLTVQHGPPRWSPDGRYLLFQRFDNNQTNPNPAIYLLEIETGTLTAVVEAGILPAWLP